MRSYILHDFMEYPNLAFRLAMIMPFTLTDASKSQHSRNRNRNCLLHLWFIFGAVNLIYQNFGMLIYCWRAVHRSSAAVTDVAEEEEEEQLMALIAEAGSVMGLTLVAACKMWIIFWHGRRIKALLAELQQIFPTVDMQRQPRRNFKQKWLSLPPFTPSSSPRGYRVQHYAYKSQRLMKRTTVFFICCFCFYNSLPIVELGYEFQSPQLEVKFRLQSNTWYPWQHARNRTSLVAFVASYLCQLQSSLTGVAFIMAGEFMLCFFITQMQMHFDYLADALETLDARRFTATEELKLLIVYHNRLLRFSQEINHIFNISFLVNFATSSIAICLAGLSMVMLSLAHTIKYFVGMLAFLVFTLFICYNGSEFTSASDKLMPAAFYNNWHEGDMSYRKMILFILMRTERPNDLRAYKFTTVSMPTYMAILKFSYQLFTFFRAVG